MKTSVPHPDSGIQFCIIEFKSNSGGLHTATVKKDEDCAEEVAKALVFAHGYDKAVQMLQTAADKFKHTWQE